MCHGDINEHTDKLLLLELERRTGETNPHRASLEKTLVLISDVAMHINESIRQKENSERLVEIQQEWSHVRGTAVIAVYT
jgi:hypothetical protein